MRRVLIPVLVTLAVVGAMVWQALAPDAVVCEPPQVSLGEIPGYSSEELSVGEAERTVLPADTRVLKRLYRETAGGRGFLVTVVVGGKSKNSVHRPELCLPGQGFQMSDPRETEADGVDWHLVTLTKRAAPAEGFAYTFFNQDGYRTASHLRRIFRDVWDRSVRGRIDRWVMVTVCASTADDAALARFLGLLKEVL